MVLGVNYHGGNSETLERQRLARESLLRLDGCTLLNLQLENDGTKSSFEGFKNDCVLRWDSVRITGRDGLRKPILNEALETLFRHASNSGARYFGFANADIQITQSAIDFVNQHNRQTYVFCRAELENPAAQFSRMMIYGADFFVFRTDWWSQHGWRVRPYIVGEPIWDNVVAAILMCHSDGFLCNREPLVLHLSHPPAWNKSPFAEFNGVIGALDAPYFSMWAHYVAGLEELRKNDASQEAEYALRNNVFRPALSIAAQCKQVARVLKFKAFCLSRGYRWEIDLNAAGNGSAPA